MFHRNYRTIFTNTFITGLACTAIHPDLRSVLVFNAPYAEFKAATNILSQMLECATGRIVEQVSLGVTELDDDLWGSLALHHNSNQSPVVWHQGSLAGLWDTPNLRLVIIPDLAKISLATARASVMLIGADVAHLERHGQHKHWKPNMCWLANCSKAEVGSVSPHLLDRFAVRLNWQHPGRSDKITTLLDQVLNDRPANTTLEISLPEEIKQHIQQCAHQRATTTGEALERILYHHVHIEAYTPRREIALARHAVAVAQLEGSTQVTASHVDMAAYLMGLIASPLQQHGEFPSPPRQQAEEQPAPTLPEPQPVISGEVAEFKDAEKSESVPTEPIPIMEPIYAPDPPLAMDIAAIPAPTLTIPYPEDTALVEREAASLRLPLFRYASTRAGRGTIIGVERTNTLQDLALVNTLLAAAPFQPIRRKYLRENTSRLLLSSIDLRCYRREPVAEHMLLLLLDYTSLRHCNWQLAILPYLRKAYVERASICIVQVGVANAAYELRAEQVNARSILVPRIAMALNEKPGKATPLAHGLDLAQRALRHALQHGRSTVQQASLIVISDGRGNVPLEASRSGCLARAVNREGIEDALRVAKRLQNLKDVQALFLNPQPKQHRELPLLLAEALGAEVHIIERLETEEV